MGLKASPLNEQETIEPHQLLCFKRYKKKLNKLFNMLGRKSRVFWIVESDKITNI